MPDRLGKQVPFNKMEIVVTLTVLMVLALFAIVVSTIFARGSGLSRAQKLFYGHKLEDDRPLPFLDALQVPPTSNSSL